MRGVSKAVSGLVSVLVTTSSIVTAFLHEKIAELSVVLIFQYMWVIDQV